MIAIPVYRRRLVMLVEMVRVLHLLALVVSLIFVLQFKFLTFEPLAEEGIVFLLYGWVVEVR